MSPHWLIPDLIAPSGDARTIPKDRRHSQGGYVPYRREWGVHEVADARVQPNEPGRQELALWECQGSVPDRMRICERARYSPSPPG
jgi:hypothetical protein